MILLCQMILARENSQHWELSGRKAVLNEDRISTAHYLRSKVNGKFLIFKRRNFGIELGWTAEVKGSPYLSSKSFKIETYETYTNRTQRNKKVRVHNRELSYGELFAIKVSGAVKAKGHGYLVYKKRRWGINLVYSRWPSFEWKFTGGKTGTPVRGPGKPSRPLGIYNTKAKDHMVYCKRKYGPNLRWARDCKHSGKRRKKVVDHRK
jgi:hypothetical protein